MRAYFNRDAFFTIQVVAVCLTWYCCSSGQNVVNKLALQKFPFPLTIALSSLFNNVLYTIPLSRYLHVNPTRVNPLYLMKTIVPISAGRALAVGFAYFGLSKVPVSYAQTVKATMPVFTVFISRIMLGERQSGRVYISLMPVVLGVFIASATELQFNFVGLISSLLSTGIFACLNVLAKKVFDDTGMHPVTLLSLNSQLASVMLFPLWLLKDGALIWNAFTSDNFENEGKPAESLNVFVFYLFLSGVLSFVQNLCAFTLIHQLTTLSYSVSNCAKRIVVIFTSLLWLRNPVTPLNMAGMLLSVVGVLFYNRVKSTERIKRSKSPMILNDGDSIDRPEFLRRHDRHLHITSMHSSSSDVKLLLSTA